MEDSGKSENVELWGEPRMDEKYNTGMRIILGRMQYWFMVSRQQIAEYDFFKISTIGRWIFVLRSIW